MALTVDILALLGQVVLLLALAPLVSGVTRKVKARLLRRIGPPLGQPYRDIWKLAHKDLVLAHNASWVFRAVPYVVFAVSLTAAVLIPTFSSRLIVFGSADLVAIVALLATAQFALALAGMDVGTAFGGIGSSRTMMVASLAKPAMLLVIFTVALIAGTTQLPAIAEGFINANPSLRLSLGLAAFAFVCVAVAENGRMPVDNPATHLELTMVQEAMALEYSGRHLALIEAAAALKLVLYFSLFACLFVPYGMATAANDAPALAIGLAAYLGKILAMAVLLPVCETAVAKMQVFRTPGFLGGAFVSAALAVLVLFVSRGF